MDTGKTQLLGDFCYSQLGFTEKPFGFPDLERQKEMNNTAVSLVFKNALDCTGREAGGPADI